MNEEPCAILAQTRLGEVKRCHVGCTHLTFAGVSLHFDSFDEFIDFTELVSERDKLCADAAGYELNYRWVAINMCPDSFKSLIQLMKSALEEAVWRDGRYSAESIPFVKLFSDQSLKST